MGEANEKLLPGTSATYIEPGERGFSRIEMLISATGGLSLSQVCAVTGLEGTTIQNWVKRGWVEHPKGKKYEENHIARILIINALKECIKLEHIAMLLEYVNYSAENANDGTIKESELFNYLCDALIMIDEADDLSRAGIETVAEKVVRSYEGRTPDAKDKIRKTLILMVYACVCTDVKRRTELMMRHVMREIKSSRTKNLADKSRESGAQQDSVSQAKREPRKTVIQAIREWDMKSIETAPEEENTDKQRPEGEADREQDGGESEPPDDSAATKPVYFGKG